MTPRPNADLPGSILAKVLVVLLLAGALAACGKSEERVAGYMQKAQAYYEKGDYVNARLEARNAVQIQPKNAKANYLLALIAEKRREFRPMIQGLRLAVESDPNMVAARVKLGTLYFFGQVFPQAAEQAKAATALAPEDPGVRLLNARVLLHDKDVAGAIKELDAILAKAPDDLEALALRAAAEETSKPGGGLKILDQSIARLNPEKSKSLREVRISVLAQANRKEDIEKGFQDLIRDFPKDEKFRYQLAGFYAREGRVDEAETLLRNVVAQVPGDVTSRLSLAQFLAETRSPALAEQTLEAFVAEEPDKPELRVALGGLYEANGKPDAALAVYEEAAKQSPESEAGVAARVRMAALRIKRNETAVGRNVINAVLGDEPDNADALLIRAGLRASDRQFEDAIADVRTVLSRQPANTRALLVMARIHAIMQERGLAKDSYRRLLEVEPRNTEAAQELAALEAVDGNFDGAEAALRARLKLDPADIDSSMALINVLGAQKAWARAEAEARRLADLPDDQGAGQYQLGRLLRAQERNVDAEAAFRKALEKNPTSTLALAGLIGVLTDMNQKDEAMQALQSYRRKHPDDVAGKYLEGWVLAGNFDRPGALRMFNEVIAAKPDMIGAWIALANLQEDDVAARVEIYRRGIAANPANADLGLLLSAQYEQMGRYEDAIANYQRLLAANPAVDLAANNLASLLLDHRTDAPSHAKALQLVVPLENTADPAVLDTVGWAYYRTGSYRKALEILEEAVVDAGDVPQVRYHLGMAYLATDNPARAREELRLAVGMAESNYPGLNEARSNLKKLGD